MDKQPYHQEAERLAKDQVFVPEKFRPMDKQTADKNERVVVRILDNGEVQSDFSVRSNGYDAICNHYNALLTPKQG